MSTEPASTSRSGERNTKSNKRTVEVPETEERSEEKQKRKTKSKIGKKSTGDVEEEIESPKHKEKKHKRKNRDVDAENGAPDAVDGADLPLKKKQKKRKDKEVQGAIEAEDEKIAELQATEKIKKESMDKDKGSRDADGAVASGSDSTSKEKKKHEEKKRDKKARKKETASSSLLNPADDAELTDKARGALSYAHTRLSASDGWKFNKAHQNWIVKHVFSCNDIPEKYFPVVTAYLSGCQGGVRDNLVQNCSKQLDASPEVCSAPDSTPTPVPAPSALTEDTEAEPLKLASKIPSPATQEAIKARARTLLEVLGSSSSQD